MKADHFFLPTSLDPDRCGRCWEPRALHRPDSERRYRLAAPPTKALSSGAFRAVPLSPKDPTNPKPPKPPKPKRERKARAKRTYAPRPSKNLETIVAIDGEGHGRSPHLYTYLAAVDEHGETRGEIRRASGLGTEECLEFFLNLNVSRVFGFSIGYDLTKILFELPDETIYLLCRPEARKYKAKDGRVSNSPVDWRGYRFTYVRGQLTVRRVEWSKKFQKKILKGPPVVLWDVFRFFQSKFTTALEDWQIAPAAKLERMKRMKDQRAAFDEDLRSGKITARDIEEYCREECHFLALLVRELIEAHEAVGLRLKNFFGAGSTAGCLLGKLKAKDFIKPPDQKAPVLDAMRYPVACGFAGGRFEISFVGPIAGPVYNYDISSAYPFHITFLPCLACGRWEHVTGRTVGARIRRARLALVHTHIRRTKDAPEAWGALPWRGPDGTIVFPREHEGAWCWKDEYLATERIFPGVKASEAWVYETNCVHQPFAELPDIYRERIKIGKEGRGIVLKLGPNSIYGKTAQSVGSAPYQNFIWAGNITSNTRAQLLCAFEACGDPSEWWHIRMFATDGIFSTKPLVLPKPRDTGTGELPGPDGRIYKKPLGGWEEKIYKNGMFILRPGIYFPLGASEEDLKSVKARGMSRGVLLESSALIEAHFAKHGVKEPFVVHGVEGEGAMCSRCGAPAKGHPKGLQRFVGMNAGVARPGTIGSPGWRKRPAKRSKDYGEWVDYPIVASFDPKPKRARVWPDSRLEMFPRLEGESQPYERANVSPEARLLKEAEMIFQDQANGDFTEGFR